MPRDGLWLAAIVIAIGVGAVGGVAVHEDRSRHERRRRTRRGRCCSATHRTGRGFSFVLASVVCGLVAILAAPMLQLGSGVFTFGFLVPGARRRAARPLPQHRRHRRAGLAIGMVQSSFVKLQNDLSWFPQYGAREGLPFLVIIIAMAFRGERLPERGAVDTWRLPAVPPARVRRSRSSLPVASVIGLLGSGRCGAARS